MEIVENYHKPPPLDYDAIKLFRQHVEEIERELSRATSGRVSVKSVILEHNWELWTKATEEL